MLDVWVLAGNLLGPKQFRVQKEQLIFFTVRAKNIKEKDEERSTCLWLLELLAAWIGFLRCVF